MKDNLEETMKLLLTFLHRAERLKSVPRHCITSDGTGDYVAGHCWRMALMAYLLKEKLPEVDMDKVIKMCLIHDLGEVVTGDIPSFQKTKEQEETERRELDALIRMLPGSIYEEWSRMYLEMEALETLEAKVYKALDRMEAVIQHNECDIAAWLPLEYDLQMTYGVKDAACHPVLEELRRQVLEETKQKIEVHCKMKYDKS